MHDTRGNDALMGMRRQTRVAATAGLSAGARLMRLELLATRQAQGLRIAEGQITKLNTRARLLGKDIQPPLRQARPPACTVASPAKGVHACLTAARLTSWAPGPGS